MSDDLKPCPFCGGNAKHYYQMVKPFHPPHGVKCEGCGVWVECNAANLDEASVVWNRRAGEQQ